MLYGAELRQTTLDNFFPVRKIVFPVVNSKKKEKKYVQSDILKYMKCRK
jgi:hypothetical protein